LREGWVAEKIERMRRERVFLFLGKNKREGYHNINRKIIK